MPVQFVHNGYIPNLPGPLPTDPRSSDKLATDAFSQAGVCEPKDNPKKREHVLLRSSFEGAMHKSREHRLRQSRVTAVFEDRALSFILAKGATLGELSDRLADLGQRHNGTPVAVTVKFGSSSHDESLVIGGANSTGR